MFGASRTGFDPYPSRTCADSDRNEEYIKKKKKETYVKIYSSIILSGRRFNNMTRKDHEDHDRYNI